MGYVGQTSRKMKTRLTEHKSNIRTNISTSPLAQHWWNSGHSIPQLRFQILESMPGDVLDLHNRLLQREAFWMYSLDTLSPKGLNDRTELHCFL